MEAQQLALQRIHEKLQQLLRHHQALQKEMAQLRSKYDNAVAANTRQEKEMEELKQQVDILKFSTGEMNAEEKKAFEKRINNFVKEIDRCISMLD